MCTGSVVVHSFFERSCCFPDILFFALGACYKENDVFRVAGEGVSDFVAFDGCCTFEETGIIEMLTDGIFRMLANFRFN